MGVKNPVQKEFTIGFSVDGDLSTGTNSSFEIPLPKSGTIKRTKARVKTGPTGADIIIDINIGGTSIYGGGTKLEIADGSQDGEQNTIANDSVSEDDIATLDIDQVGSGTAGNGLVVEMIIQE